MQIAIAQAFQVHFQYLSIVTLSTTCKDHARIVVVDVQGTWDAIEHRTGWYCMVVYDGVVCNYHGMRHIASRNGLISTNEL